MRAQCRHLSAGLRGMSMLEAATVLVTLAAYWATPVSLLLLLGWAALTLTFIAARILWLQSWDLEDDTDHRQLRRYISLFVLISGLLLGLGGLLLNLQSATPDESLFYAQLTLGCLGIGLGIVALAAYSSHLFTVVSYQALLLTPP